MELNRREFLRLGLSSMAYFTTASTVPMWISKSVRAMSKQLEDGRILVIVQMAGGNDGLNTVIPYTDELYNGPDLRPNLHITSGLNPTIIDGLNAFHPKLERLKDWFDDGKVAVAQNVGYPNPNLSHFTSGDFWELGTSPGSALNSPEGWIGRFFDNKCAGMQPQDIAPLSAAATGLYLLPLTMSGSTLYQPPAIFDPAYYQIYFPEDEYGAVLEQYFHALNTAPNVSSQLDFLQRSSNLAEASIADITAAQQLPALNVYPEGDLGRGLDLASRIVRGGYGTKIFYVSQSGYDTHANQFGESDPANLGDHPKLLEEFDQCIDSFLKDMESTGNLDKVVLMTFSEFGRRVYENNSAGTDHGAANSLFVIGGRVAGGVYGGQPNLEEDSLFDGSLSHSVDFRSVYSRILQDWLKVDPETIFGITDFNDPILGIKDGMAQLPFFGDSQSIAADVNNDSRVDALDVQFVINGALGQTPPVNTDINNDGGTNATDVQLVINGALGVKRGNSPKRAARGKSKMAVGRRKTPKSFRPYP